MFKKQPCSAFSLVELSATITIASLVLVAVLSTKVSSINTDKVRITQNKISIINKALGNYLIQNKRLPCPAAINTVKTDSTYGNEGTRTPATTGECDGVGSGFYTSGNLIYGMVPFKALGLNIATSSDGFDNKFAYIVDKRFTTATTTPFKSLEGGITIESNNVGSFATLTDKAMFAIISYGANGYFAFPANSSTQNPASINDNEIKNNTASFDAKLIAQANQSPAFDDIVFYQDKITW